MKVPGIEAPSWPFLPNCSFAGLHKKDVSLAHPESYYGTLCEAIEHPGDDNGTIKRSVSGKHILIMVASFIKIILSSK